MQVAKLHRSGGAGKNLSGVDERLRRLELRLRVDDLGTPITLRLCLLGDRADHVLCELDGANLDVAHPDAPVVGLRV